MSWRLVQKVVIAKVIACWRGFGGSGTVCRAAFQRHLLPCSMASSAARHVRLQTAGWRSGDGGERSQREARVRVVPGGREEVISFRIATAMGQVQKVWNRLVRGMCGVAEHGHVHGW